MPSEQDGGAREARLRRLAHLRVLVGYLGEKGQHGWWPSEFYSATSAAFLTPVFTRTTNLARYHGVSEAARRVHDEHIGIGRVFHLFRLPEIVEQAVFECLQTPAAAEDAQRGVKSVDEAMAALRSFFDSPSPAQEGPTQVGDVADLDGDLWLPALARCYHAAFAAGSPSYPYFVDRA